MKKLIFFCAIAMMAGTMTAQQGGGRNRSGMSPEERQKFMEERRTKRNADLRSVLVLTDSLARVIDAVNARYDKQQEELMAANAADMRAARSQMENIQNARNAEVKTHLSPEQQQKYDSYLNERNSNQRRGGRGNNAVWSRNPNS